ncbi:hypothetical protein BCR33DRAFT_786434 [Rhizoclosmatium globosum]|uniref:Uncharacterized protein n=1 Tax=Rhizoclosmatium globosum TaxID=329046 RepID=A0A1Y2C596_9FUNG|nr:hypothetical protein BCR33DRAFT_786434 [Rhizoclosmatium globosum]|eukprot:ORY42209.1 hypothetical protein BCR33DRAFT_786434 [Rhizoclosmatium globosum]
MSTKKIPSQECSSNMGVIVGVITAKSYNDLIRSPFRTLESSSGLDKQPMLTASPSVRSSTRTISSTSFGTFDLENNNRDEKAGGTIFGAMNLMVELNPVSAKMPTIGRDGIQYVDFDGVLLPAIPSQWTVSHVVAWASRNEATSEIIALIKHEQLDGHTFLLMKVDDFNFQFPSLRQRLHFRAALENLVVLNEERLKAMEISAVAAPPYEV